MLLSRGEVEIFVTRFFHCSIGKLVVIFQTMIVTQLLIETVKKSNVLIKEVVWCKISASSWENDTKQSKKSMPSVVDNGARYRHKANQKRLDEPNQALLSLVSLLVTKKTRTSERKVGTSGDLE